MKGCLQLALALGALVHLLALITPCQNALDSAVRSTSQQGAVAQATKEDCATPGKFTPSGTNVTFAGPEQKTLYGWLYKPKGKGPFPAIVWNHGSGQPNEERGMELVTFFTSHGYVFFVPHRTGHGLSKEVGKSVIEKDIDCAGMVLPELRRCRVKHQEEANPDVVAAVEWLKAQPFVRRKQIAVAGASYGGIQTVLTAEKQLGVRAFIPFTPGAMSWANVELRKRLLTAVEKARVPIFLIQAEGDYSTGPYEVLGGYLNNKGGLNRAKLYPKFGATPREAHAGFVIRCQGIEIWGNDVLAFLKAAMK